MKELLEILVTHQYEPNNYVCFCNDSIELYRDTHRTHLAEMLKPLLAKVWDDGYAVRDDYEFEPTDTTNPYKEATE